MSIKELREFAKDKIAKYPDLKPDIVDIYSLAVSEIEDGSPPEHEVELAINDITELVSDHERKML